MQGRTKIIIMTSFVIAGTAAAFLWGSKSDLLSIGSTMPKLRYISKNDSGYISIKDKPLMIMNFKPDCPHCEYELGEINKMVEEFAEINVICLTTEKKFISSRGYDQWSKLANSKNFMFASIDKDEYMEQIGIEITPLFLFYGIDGLLKAKIIGETRFDRILDSIVKTGVAQHR